MVGIFDRLSDAKDKWDLVSNDWQHIYCTETMMFYVALNRKTLKPWSDPVVNVEDAWNDA